MNWNKFKTILEQHPQLVLQFEYAPNSWVNPAYHITEIKQAPITSVDCGGALNTWTEIILQLWEPEGQDQERDMQVHKALAIIAIVEKALPLEGEALVKIEFGNTQFDTRQMLLNGIAIQDDNMIVNLKPDAVQCKAQERGGRCGPTPPGDECCTPAAKPKVKLINLVQSNTCCTPGAGCC